ncbi:MAG: DNA alkylation repair protein [Flavobacterium sp.]|nr:DNA alkylation repair protein [Flavobacterium sp.]
MTILEILSELESFAKPSIKKVMLNHGAKEPFYGVAVGDLKKIQKKIKKDYNLSLELYKTGISDAMYLAGLIADDKKMSKIDLQNWLENAYWYMLSEYTVPWVAAESNFGHELALEWILSENENIAACGWSTYSNLLALTANENLDINEIKSFLEKIENEIHQSQNRVKQTMNGFIISVGSYVQDLTELAIATGNRIGKIIVNMGGIACKTPFAPNYIEKIKIRNGIGKKKKTVKC